MEATGSSEILKSTYETRWRTTIFTTELIKNISRFA
jgi:hypothetical protein